MVATWTGAVSDDWNNDDNWSPAVIPGAGDAIVIPATPPGGSQPEILDGETVNVDGDITNDDALTLASTGDQTNFVINGSVTLSGTGTLTLTDSAANRIFSNTSGSTLDNQETIKGAGQIFNNDGLSLKNDTTGVVDATGSNALDISGITVENLGLLESSAGNGGLALAAATVDNTDGGTVDSGRIEAAGGNVLVENSVDIIGGTLSSTTGSQIEVASVGSTLDGSQSAAVDIAKGGVVAVENGENLTLEGVIQNDGQIQLNATGASNTDLIVNGAVTLKGTGDILLSDVGTTHYNRIYTNQSNSTLDNQQTIEGAGEIFSNDGLTLDNDTTGVVDATGTNSLDVHNIAIENQGVLESTAGSGGLELAEETIDNTDAGTTDSGQIEAEGGNILIEDSVHIIGGTLSSASGDQIEVLSTGGTLDGGQSAEVDIANGSIVAIENGDNLVLNGAIENDGQLQLNATGADNTDLILNGAVTLKGDGDVILSDVGSIHFNRIFSNQSGSTLDNQETIEGAGEIFTNDGLTLNNDDVIDANGAFALAVHDITVNNADLLESTGTGGLSIYNATVNNLPSNDSGQIVANGAGTHVDIYNSTIVGGKLLSENGGVINVTTGGAVTFDGTNTGAPIDITGGSVVAIANSATLDITGTIQNDGQLQLNATGADNTDLIVNGAVTLKGAGEIVLSDEGAIHFNRIYTNQSGSTLNNQETIEGAGEIFSNDGLTLNNDDVIDANGVNGLAVHDITVNNADLLESTGTGGLSIYNATVNNLANNDSGRIVVNGAGANVNVHNSTIVGGKLVSENGAVINVTTGGAVAFDGTHAGAPFDIASGSVVAVADSATLDIAGTIQNDGQLQLNATGADNTDLIANGAVTLKGVGEVVMSDDGSIHFNRIYTDQSGSTLNNQETIEGAGEIFSNDGLTLNNDDVIDATGANALAVHDLAVNNADLLESTGTGGLAIYDATVSNLVNGDSGQIVADGAGTHVAIYNSTIVGGKLVSENGGIINVTTGGADLFDGTNTSAPIDITGGSVVTVADGATLDINGTIQNDGQLQLNATGADNTDLIANGAVTLTGAGAVILSDEGSIHFNRIYTDQSGSTLDNQETIEGAGEIFSNDGLTLNNDDVIDATGANALEIHAITVNNADLLESTGTGGLLIDIATINNLAGGDSGQIVAYGAGAHVDIGDSTIIGGDFVSQNGGIINVTTGGADVFDGTNSGAPIDITANSIVAVADSGVLDIEGTIQNDGQLQLNATGADNTDLVVNGDTTLAGDGAVVLSDEGTIHYNRIYSNVSGSTLDNQETIEGAGEILSGNGLILVNDATGVINANGVNALDIHNISFTNDGTVSAGNGGTLDIDDALTNISADPNHSGGSVLTGGAYNLVDQATYGDGPGAASTIAISGNGATEITTLAATVDLAGQPSQLTSNGVSLANSLLEVADDGNLNLYYGYNSGYSQDFADPNAVTIDQGGQVSVTGADFSTAELTIANGGYLLADGEFDDGNSIYASVEGPIVNNGLIVADGVEVGATQPTSYFDGPISGSGGITLDQDALAEFGGGVGDDQTIYFGNDQVLSNTQVAGEQTIRIDSTTIDPSATGRDDFAATIANFTIGDAIDLTNFDDVSDYTYHNGALTIFFESDQVATLNFSGLADEVNFYLSSDGDAGTLITLGTGAELANDTGASATDGVTDDAALTGTGDAGAFLIFTENGDRIGSTVVDDNGLWSFTPSGLEDGAQTIVVNELSGNFFTEVGSVNIALATQAPTASASQTLSGVTNRTTDVISGVATAEDVAGNGIDAVEIIDVDDDIVQFATLGADGAYSATLTDLGDGGHIYDVVTVDLAGNATSTQLSSFIIATQAPTVTASESVSGTTTQNDDFITATAVAENPDNNSIASVIVYDGQTELGAATLNEDVWIFNADDLALGVHDLSLVTTDVAGNSVTTTLAPVDVVSGNNPAVNASISTPGLTNQTSETISETAIAGAGNTIVGVEVFDNNQDLGAASFNSQTQAWNFTADNLGDGENDFSTITTDSGDNQTTTALPVVDIATELPQNGSATESISGLTKTTSDTISVIPTAENVPGNGVASVEILDTSTNTTTAATLGAGGVYSATLTGLGDGAHVFDIVTTDKAGNVTKTALAAVEVATQAPVNSAPGETVSGITRTTSDTVSVTPTAENVPGNGVSAVVIVDTTTNTTTAATLGAGGVYSATLTGLADGEHSFEIVTTDEAGNQTTTSLAAVDIATQAPTMSAGETVSGTTTQTSDVLTAAATAENVPGNAIVSVLAYDGQTELGAATLSNGVWSYTAANLALGGHTFSLTATDAAGNFTTKTLAPVNVVSGLGPIVNAEISTPGLTKQTSETISETATASTGNSVAGVEVYDNGADLGAASFNSGSQVWSFTATGLADGVNDFSTITTDSADNQTTTALPVVDIATQAPVNGSPNESVSGITKSTIETISVTPTTENVPGDGVASVEILDTSTSAQTAATLGAGGVYSATLTGLGDGAHLFEIITTDNAGNSTTTQLNAVDIATQAPTVNASESVSGTTTQTSDVLSATVAPENVPGNAIVSVLAYDGHTELGSATLSNGVWIYTANGLSLGEHDFSLVANDSAGNSTTSTLTPVDVVSSSGLTVNASISSPGLTNQNSETISETATAAQGNTVIRVEVFDNDVDLGAASFNSDTQSWSFDANGLADGENDFTTVTTDSSDTSTTTMLPAVDIATVTPVNGSPGESVSGLTSKTSETISVTPMVENVAGNGVFSVEVVDTSTHAAIAATLGAGGVYSATLTGLSDGEHVFDIVTTDKAGNASTTLLNAVDVATQKPTVDASESVSGTTGLTTDIITATVAAEPVSDNSIASVVVYDGGAELGQAVLSAGLWRYTASGLALGTHDFSLLATDAAGNSKTTTLAPVDIIQPLTVSAAESVSGLTNLTSDTVSATVSAAPGLTVAGVEVFDGDSDLGAASYDAATNLWSFSAQGLSDGVHDLSILTTDGIGDTLRSTLSPVEVATAAPRVTASQNLSGLTKNNLDTVTEIATAEAVGANAIQSVEIYDGAANLGAATLSAGIWTFTEKLPDGAHHLETVTTDAAGNQTTTTLPVIHVATNLPRVKVSESVSGLTNQSSVTVSETAIAEQVAFNTIQSVEVYDGAKALGAATLAAGVWTFTPTLADGEHDLSTVTTDAAGNTTTKTLAPVDVATTPPSVQVSQTLGKLGNQNQDLITETAIAEAVGANAIETVEIYDGATDLGAAALLGGIWTFTTGILADGAHHLETVTTDAAGNQATTTLPVIRVATNPPRVRASESISGPTNQSSVTVTETAIAEALAGNAIESVEVYDGATTLGAATLSGGVWTFTTSTLANGVHRLHTVTTDAAGNTTTKTLAAVDVAITPPVVTASQTLGKLNKQNQDTITETATVDAVGVNAIESVEVYDGATALGAATLSGAAWTFTTGILGDGAHHLDTVTTDTAGNATTTTLPVVRVATNPPRVKASESISGLTNQSQVTVTETAIAEAVAGNAIQSVEVYDGATALGAATLSGGGWTFIASLTDGAHHLHTVTSDVAGNTTSKTLAAVDVATAPPIVSASQSLSGLTNQTQDLLTETATAEAVGGNTIVSVEVFDGSNDLGAAVFSGGSWTFATQELAFGAHDLSTVTTDAAGNTTTTLLAPIDVEPPAPNVTIALVDDTSDGLDITSDDALSGDGDPDATVHFAIDGSPTSQTATADTDGSWMFTPTGLSDGLHTIVASESNGGGAGGATLSFVYVATPPSVSIVTPSGAVAFPSETIDGGGEANTTVQLFDGLQKLGATVTVAANGLWSDTVTLTGAGAHTITAADTDAANNLDVSSSITLFLDNQIVGQPTQTQVTSASGDDHIIVAATNATVTALGSDNTVSLTTGGGSAQFHIITGGGGSNTLDLSGTGGGAIVDLGAQLATGPEIGKNDVFNFQNIIGGAGPETLTLNSAPGGGVGPAGGGAGTPTQSATPGGGFIEAGSGDDIMTGGPGDDSFVFLSSFGNDTITNFVVSGSTHDVFEVSQSLFSNWSAIDGALSDTAAGAELVLNAAETVTFTGLSKAALEANAATDFRVV